MLSAVVRHALIIVSIYSVRFGRIFGLPFLGSMITGPNYAGSLSLISNYKKMNWYNSRLQVCIWIIPMFVPLRSLLLELSQPHQTLLRTQQLHALISKTRLSRDPFFATKLVRLYAINDDLRSARNLFDETPGRSVLLWNSIIRAYARTHEYKIAFSLFKEMLGTEIKPDNFTYACLIRACYENLDLDGMKFFHGGVIVSGLESDSICASALVTGYSKLCLVDEASKVFYGIPDPDLVLWNSLISGCGHSGFWNKGLQLFNQMRYKGKKPDDFTLVGLLSGLANSSLLLVGRAVHSFCLKNSFDSDAHVGSSLICMYSRCSCMDSANGVFNGLLQPDLVAWSALITGYSQSGEFEKALLTFSELIMEGRKTDPTLLSSVLAAAARLTNLWAGKEIHGFVLRNGFKSDVLVSSALIDMYSKCGSVVLGTRVFEIMPEKNVISYNTLISGLGLNGFPFQAFKIFDVMLENGLKPDDCTLSALLSACCHAGLVSAGREIFWRMRFEFSVQARTKHYVHMVKLLGMAGELEEAYNLVLSLPETVDSGIWGALLSCCDFHGNCELAEIAAQKLFENEPEKGAYRVMLSNTYAGDGRWDDVQKLRDDITEQGVIKVPGLSWVGSGSY